MASIQFNIEAYSLMLRPRQVIARIITVSGPANTHGIKQTASLYFYQDDKVPDTLGRVVRVNPTSILGPHVTAYLSLSDYQDIYHTIQTESPVGLYASFDNTTKSNATVDLSFFQVYSREENPGEGFIDADVPGV